MGKINATLNIVKEPEELKKTKPYRVLYGDLSELTVLAKSYAKSPEYHFVAVHAYPKRDNAPVVYKDTMAGYIKKLGEIGADYAYRVQLRRLNKIPRHYDNELKSSLYALDLAFKVDAYVRKIYQTEVDRQERLVAQKTAMSAIQASARIGIEVGYAISQGEIKTTNQALIDDTIASAAYGLAYAAEEKLIPLDIVQSKANQVIEELISLG